MTEPLAVHPQLPLALRLRDGADFGAFVDGANGACVAHLRALAGGETRDAAYIWGPAGSGRTHLAEATVRAALDAGLDACLLPASELLALDPSVLDGMEAFSLVVLDDLPLLAGRREWEVALFHLYNRCRDTGGGLLFSADSPPSALALGLPDLASRLAAGAVFRLQPLDEDGLARMLVRRAERRGLSLSAEVASYVVNRGQRDAGSLLALLDQLDQRALAERRRLTVPFIKQALGW